jgi:type II secretory ATPase GspE/PulE/Tfp pilus assembly ATPase PilB-like protein/ActR/RegA family two-component response regulator
MTYNDDWLAAIISPLLKDGALEKVRSEGEMKDSLWERVIDMRLLPEAEILTALSARCRLPIADLASASRDAVDAVPESLARRHMVVPLMVTDALLEVATSNPFDIGAEQSLAFATGREVRVALASPPRIREKLDELYGKVRSGTVAELLVGMENIELTSVEEVEDEVDAKEAEAEASSRPIIKLVDVLLHDGITSRASDIHIESAESAVLVRYRIDGVLRQAMTIPRKAGIPLISRIKIMSGLDIADRMRPQDGRARVAVGDTPIDLRISTLPAQHGEKVVIRILNTQQTMLSLDSLGLYEEDREVVKALLSNKEGVILCTGPTGSGKTTTLYACIRHIQAEGINIVTVEDPVEYRLGKNIVQVQTNEKAGLTFATALRSILRQDPDIVLVGEIRDLETMQVAIQASLTGHLVLSTLHTNDAPNTITRLVDMGLEAFKLGASLRGIIAQRLMRRICPVCRTPMPHDELPPRIKPFVPRDATLWKPVGCGQCTQTGYRGRFSIVEILTMSPELERLVGANAMADELAEVAQAEGMRSLFDCALRHALDGNTSIDEVLRVTDIPTAGKARARATALPRTRSRGKGRATAPATVEPLEEEATSTEQLFEGIELLDEPPAVADDAAATVQSTILLVEDEDSLRRVMRDLLEAEGYRVFEARDGSEALEEVDRHNPSIVLLDLNLPNVDGFTVLSQLRSRTHTADVPILVVSARGDEDNEVRALHLGATDFISKPFRPRALAARIEIALQRRRG